MSRIGTDEWVEQQELRSEYYTGFTGPARKAFDKVGPGPRFFAFLAVCAIFPFTTDSDDIPRAFRVGECREISPERTESNVLLFWRNDERTEQREIKVETVDKNDTWLVNKVSR